MAVDTSFSFAGIGFAESQNRESEHRSGLPAQGAGAILLSAPVKRTCAVAAMNQGPQGAHVRMKHQGADKTVSGEYLTALAASSTHYVGKLQFGAIVKGSVSITNAGAPVTIVDDSAGGLYDTGFVGVAANKRGTINYTTGNIDLTFGASPTEPVQADYQHADYADFESASQTTTKAAAAYPFTIQSGIGRVVPGSIAITETTPLTFVDDGKGNIIETTGGGAVNSGSVDYATGVVTITTGTASLAGTVTMTYKYNPFAALLAAAGGQKLLDIYSMLPELTNAPYAAGVKGESKIGLWGETRFNSATSAITTSFLQVKWMHFGEEPFRVTEDFASFPAGGHDNDPMVDHTVAHL